MRQPQASVTLKVTFENRADEADRFAKVLVTLGADQVKITRDAKPNTDGSEKPERQIQATFSGVTDTLLTDIAKALELTDDSEKNPLFEAQG